MPWEGRDVHITPRYAVNGIGARSDVVSLSREDAAVVLGGGVASPRTMRRNANDWTFTRRRWIVVQTSLLGEPRRGAALHLEYIHLVDVS